jgi:hypothetical protein
VPQGALDKPGVHAGFEQMGGVGRPQGMDGHAGVGDPGSLLCGAAGTLATAPTHGGGCGRPWVVSAPGGGKAPDLVTMGVPGGAEERQRLGREGDVPVFRALAAVDMDLEALAIKVGDLEGEGFREPEAHTRDGGAVRLLVQGGSRLQKTSDFFHPADGGEPVGGLSPHERQRVPITLEDVLGEAAETAGADAQGSGGEAIDVFAVQQVVLKLLFRDQVWRCAIALSQQAALTDRGFLSPFALTTELKRGDHVLTQWGHEMSPFVSGRVIYLSKGGHRKRQGSSMADMGGVKALPRQRLT